MKLYKVFYKAGGYLGLCVYTEIEHYKVQGFTVLEARQDEISDEERAAASTIITLLNDLRGA
jgi:hypothetical protein